MYNNGLTFKKVSKCIKMIKGLSLEDWTPAVSQFKQDNAEGATLTHSKSVVYHSWWFSSLTHRISVWPCWPLTSLFTPGPRFTLSELEVHIHVTCIILSQYYFLLECINTEGLSCQTIYWTEHEQLITNSFVWNRHYVHLCIYYMSDMFDLWKCVFD